MPAPWQGKANFKRTLGTKKPEVAKVEASKALRDCTIALQNAKRAMRNASYASGHCDAHTLRRCILTVWSSIFLPITEAHMVSLEIVCGLLMLAAAATGTCFVSGSGAGLDRVLRAS